MNRTFFFWKSEMNSNKKLKTRKAACRFSPQEDMIIKYFVAENGPRQWNRIESFLPFRTARQCRDRYNNYLRPGLTIENWTDEEEKLLQQKVKEFGKKWTIIAKFFHGRSTNCLKNHWNYRKVKRDDYSDTNKKQDDQKNGNDENNPNKEISDNNLPFDRLFGELLAGKIDFDFDL